VGALCRICQREPDLQLFARIMLRRQNGSAFFRRRLNAERPYYSRYNFPGRRPKIPGAGPLLRRNVAGQVIAQIAWPNAPDWTIFND